MKAIVHHQYGPPDLLGFSEIEVPAVADDEVLVRVRAASVNPYDWHHVTGTPYIARLGGGWRAPRQLVPGVDLAGRVEAVGRDVTRFRPGDEVFGMRAGAFAEYVSVPEGRLAPKPANLTFEEAAAVPMAALTALQGLRDRGGVRPGQRVLVNGASGGVGTFAVQLARHFGAEVTGVCGTRNVEAARALGAHHVIDYTGADFTAGGRTYDLILDVAGNRSIADRRRALTPTGTLVVVGGPQSNRWFGPAGALLRVLVASRFGGQRMVGMLARCETADLLLLRDLLEAGTVVPAVERTYPLREVPQALRQVGEGHARGKTVITV
ncbi:NADPH:quinone reductase [Longispora fulva]|uniref:NADPH:quinone reductase-like Zn-dependent oxidoreductase n=1 Tax=Longispora fulva TaxID=619741 RepID=A0A8J7GBZ1_9ACTN|nr:NAD(P)-dependent alcohol dehydrogenase [Longispora fulva]MBG6134741.1 NADPH:quinone reductase-like Zn-dependent oxidoreductase [Longispora fulva]GIG61952.1 NADPH:quinone reductase [Longispora fulva]